MMTSDWKDALGALLPEDYKPEEQPQEQQPEAKWPKLQVTLDRKRAGKTATIISGFEPDDPRAATLAAMLKKKLATGGSARGGEILIQGDRVNEVKKIISTL